MIIISFLLFFLELSLSCLPLKRQKPGIDTLSVRRLSICYLFFLTLSPSIILSIYLPKAVTLSCVTPSFIYLSFFLSLFLPLSTYLSSYLSCLCTYVGLLSSQFVFVVCKSAFSFLEYNTTKILITNNV